ncbi:hypothetical protein GCM10018772_68860 [Streptomyces fumanus]|uniref:Uncharacterized protein n=1 Tax=Streptomyces fumanus TaxID=67302 RepID=A0A919B122_9ACTN|nr:hypothetical protein GCM10018772_68860 [Streptomyces fumanus]
MRWETAIAADNTDGREARVTYYLNRFRTRAARAFSATTARPGTRAPSGVAASGLTGL